MVQGQPLFLHFSEIGCLTKYFGSSGLNRHLDYKIIQQSKFNPKSGCPPANQELPCQCKNIYVY